MKTIKNYIWMAAATMMVAVLGACSSDDLAVKETPIQKGKIVTLTATLSPKESNADMRALTDNGTTIGSAWAVNEEVCVEYTNGDEDFVDAKGIITAVDGDGKATITVDLINPKEGDTDIYFHYPYNIAKEIKDITADQIGTLDDIAANFDDFDGDGTLNVTGDVATLPSDVSMTRNVCIWKLAFKVGSNDITNTITALNINVSEGAREYDITPNALNAIYVALGNVNNTDVTFTAATPSGIYSFSKDEVTLNPGYFYRSTVTLTAAASGTYREYFDRTNFDNIDIPAGATTVTSGTTAWTNGTYVVSGNVTINSDITVTGDAKLILKDGASLTVNGTITGDNLNIYGQTLSTGKLDVVYNNTNVVLNNIAIHGGIITVTEGGVMQGIEANSNLDIYHGKVTTAGTVNGFTVLGDMHVFGGDITASATGGAALQIFGADVPGSLTMTGGTFRATGTGTGPYNKGILVEEGSAEGTATVNISGGTLIVTGGASSNTDSGADAIDIQGTLTINGTANVTANGGTDEYGMGGGYGIKVRAGSSAGGNAIISGGTVTATSGPGEQYGKAAIYTNGNLTISGATTQIDATGGDTGEGILAGGTITISGGNTTAQGGTNGGKGIVGNLTIDGGIVTTLGGDATTPGKGADGYDLTLTMTGGKLIATGGIGAGGYSSGKGISGSSTIVLTGVTMYEGDSPNPSVEAASQTACTKRYVIIQ